MTFTFAHQGAEGRWRRIEDIDLVLVDHLPEPGRRRVCRNTFEDERGRPIGERAIHDVAVSRHPADVRSAPVNVAVVVVEDELVSHRGVDEITARRMQHTLRLVGRP